MSKRYNIRWHPSDDEDLRKAVRNFNDKIRRLEKKPDMQKSALPEKITVRQMKELIDTRQDLKRELNALRRFSKRGAEQIVTLPDTDNNIKTTKWQKEEMNRRVGIINRRRKERLEFISDIDMTNRGENLGYKKGQLGMGKQDEAQLRPMNVTTPGMTQTSLKKKFAAIMKESQSSYWQVREKVLKENYITSLEQNYNPKDIKDVIKAIDAMSFEEFYKVFQAEGGSAVFEFSYYPDEESYAGYVDALKKTWIPGYDSTEPNKLRPSKRKKDTIMTTSSNLNNFEALRTLDSPVTLILPDEKTRWFKSGTAAHNFAVKNNLDVVKYRVKKRE